MLTSIEHKSSKENEWNEEIRHEEYSIHVVLGQISYENSDKSSNCCSEDDTVGQVPESLSSVVQVVIVENLEQSQNLKFFGKLTYRVGRDPDWNTITEEIADYFTQEPHIFRIPAVFDFLEDHLSIEYHTETCVYDHSEIAIGDDEQYRTQTIRNIFLDWLTLFSPVFSGQVIIQNTAECTDEYHLEQVKVIWDRLALEVSPRASEQDHHDSEETWSDISRCDMSCHFLVDFLVKIWQSTMEFFGFYPECFNGLSMGRRVAEWVYRFQNLVKWRNIFLEFDQFFCRWDNFKSGYDVSWISLKIGQTSCEKFQYLPRRCSFHGQGPLLDPKLTKSRKLADEWSKSQFFLS